MKSNRCSMVRYGLIVVLTVVSLSMLWSVNAYSQSVGPNSVCIINIVADGEVLTNLANLATNFNIVILVPPSQSVNVPVQCRPDVPTDVNNLAMAVANQESGPTTVTVTVYNNKGTGPGGEVHCTKGPYTLQGNGGRGITFANCL